MSSTLYLASKSPRRQEILRSLGYSLLLLPAGRATRLAYEGDEERLTGESAYDYVVRTATEKARQAFLRITGENLPLHPVVAADTTVVLGEEILGKPADREEELEFLSRLSGRTHIVRTAVAAGLSEERILTAVSESLVTFSDISRSTAERYAATDEPYDKAGGYAVQGLAACFISRIEGSFSGIMGLPVFETADLLSRLSCSVPVLSLKR